MNNEPWFFNTEWICHRWPCYYYVSNGLIVILYYIWQYLKQKERIRTAIKIVAGASYEIFLVQMCVIFLLKQNAINVFDNETINFALWLITIWCISIFGGIYFCKVYNKFLENICTRKLLRS